jgi:hypothetical protein
VIALFGEDVFVVVEELEVYVLALFEVFEEDGPVVVEVGLQNLSVLEVHTNKYIIFLFIKPFKLTNCKYITNEGFKICKEYLHILVIINK